MNLLDQKTKKILKHLNLDDWLREKERVHNILKYWKKYERQIFELETTALRVNKIIEKILDQRSIGLVKEISSLHLRLKEKLEQIIDSWNKKISLLQDDIKVLAKEEQNKICKIKELRLLKKGTRFNEFIKKRQETLNNKLKLLRQDKDRLELIFNHVNKNIKGNESYFKKIVRIFKSILKLK